MKSLHLVPSLLAMLALTSSAVAMTGNYDGKYDVDYQVLDVTLTCDDTSEQLTFDLVDEQVTIDAFAELSADIYGRIEAADLDPRVEQAAYKATDLFFEGMTDMLNDMFLSYPDSFDIEALMGSSERYAFLANLEDVDYATDDYQIAYSTVGYMDEGMFEGLPFEPTISLDGYDYINDYVSAVGFSGQVEGLVQEGMGEGSIRWGAELTSTGLYRGQAMTCRIDTVTEFDMAM